MDFTRRDVLKYASSAAIAAAVDPGFSFALSSGPDVGPDDRIFIANEDSNTITVIDPRSNSVETTINLTSFDEDPRPPFRFVTGGVMPTHAAMVLKPLYHGCIGAHGAVPSPDGMMLATTGRGSSNVYLIDTLSKKVIGNSANPSAGPTTNMERLSGGILAGREPHEPTFTRNGKELWVAVRGEGMLAIMDVATALKAAGNPAIRAVKAYLPTINGPSQVWFSKDGTLAFVISQKVAKLDIFRLNPDAEGYSHPVHSATVDISAQDRPAFTPFEKTSPDGEEIWLSHKLADSVSAVSTKAPFEVLHSVSLGNLARPNHLEFVENGKGRAVYVSLARVDDGGPDGNASSRIAIIDRSAGPKERKVVKTFFSHGREAHGLWTNPAGNLLYIAHEQDELPNTPQAGQTVCSAFDVSDPFDPKFITRIPLGSLKLPSGELRSKKSINLVYVRPGFRGQTA